MAGLYLHIPFCKRRCIYCDFYSTTQDETVRRQYIEALCREMELRRNELPGNRLDTIYIGGGTPSQLTPQELEWIFACTHSLFDVSETAEITLEANPDDLDEAYVGALRTLPVNRISIGIQTFDDRLLRLLHRRHSADQARRAIERCWRHDFENISADLIYGLPGQSLDDWKQDLETMLKQPVRHLSAYALIYEEETMLWNMRRQHLVEEADEELSLVMFDFLIDRTQESGWEHYEISNFCMPGFMARHNSSYWTGIPYLGCGPSAHSYNGSYRQWNRPDLADYLKAKGDVYMRREGAEAIATIEPADTTSRFNDCVITALRTTWGLDLQKVASEFGKGALHFLMECARPHLKQKTLELIAPTSEYPRGRLRLTRSGIFLSDRIMSDLLLVD